MSNNATSEKLREKLSTWLDCAKQGPVFINRDEEKFTLITEEAYRDLQQKVLDLQSSLIAVLESRENVVNKNLNNTLSTIEKYRQKKP